jgi:hypothetical protein
VRFLLELATHAQDTLGKPAYGEENFVKILFDRRFYRLFCPGTIISVFLWACFRILGTLSYTSLELSDI